MIKKFASLILLIFISAAVLNSCSKSDSSTNTDPCAGKTIVITPTVTPATSSTSATGAISVTASGSTGFTYSIGTGAYQSGGSFTGLAAGNYTINVKDVAGCVKSQVVTVTSTSCPTITVTGTTTAASSSSATNGAINATASGSTGFTYSLNGGAFQATGNFSNLGVGTYVVIAKDANGCTGTHSFNITATGCPVINVSIVTTQTSSTGSTGTATVTATGGVSPYQYSLNSGAFQSGNVFSNMSAGSFTISVKDANSCTGSATGTITVATPSTFTIDIASFAYSPNPASVTSGTIVKWHNSDGANHTATSDTGIFDTGTIPGGGTSSGYTTSTPGTYPYHCLIHGTSMAGTLIVTP